MTDSQKTAETDKYSLTSKRKWILPFNYLSLAHLTFKSSLVIAFLLVLSDAIAIIPETTDIFSWLLRCSDLWLRVMIIWYISFFSILLGVCWILNEIYIDEKGVKLGRFSKVMSWNSIQAVTTETQPFFSKIFLLRKPAVKMTVFTQDKPNGRVHRKEIPSFFFSEAKFSRFTYLVCLLSTGVESSGLFLAVSKAGKLDFLRKNYCLMNRQRLLITLLISLSLTVYLGRKTAVNYLFNAANVAYINRDYVEAASKYDLATKFDPTFAVAFDHLARTEYYLGRNKEAAEHFQRALALKPDMVEPRIGLSYLAMTNGQYSQAEKLLTKAGLLAPRDPSVLINKCALNTRLGCFDEVIKNARFLLMIEPGNTYAVGYLAAAFVDSGHSDKALKLLNTVELTHPEVKQMYLCRLAKAKAYVATNELDKARVILQDMKQEFPGDSTVASELTLLDKKKTN